MSVYLSRQDTYLHRLISGSQSFFFDLEFLRNVSEIALFSFIHSFIHSFAQNDKYKQEFVRPRWPYDMRPSARAEKYIRDAGP